MSLGAGSAASDSLAGADAAPGSFAAASPESGTAFGGIVWSAGFTGADGLAEVLATAGSATGGCAAAPVGGCASGGAGFAVGSTGTTGAAAAAESGGGTGGELTGALLRLTVGFRMNPAQG
jgi:hypothetical protein